MPTTHSRKDGKWGHHPPPRIHRLSRRFRRAFTSAIAAPAQPVTPLHEIFKGEGTNANTFLDGVGVNGIGTAMFLDVFRDSKTGDTFLLLRVIAHSERGSNSTTHWLFGAIPTTDFVIDSDLRLATLNTTINTSDGQFDNADIGPIVDLAISLTWTLDSWGQRVVTSRFFERIPGTTIGHWETYHQNGPRAFGPMTGTFGDAEIE
jgi:hypothetical protein